MILSGKKIQEEVTNGNIIISPFSAKQINPNSYNYRLGGTLMFYKVQELDVKKQNEVESIKIGPEGYVLQPDRVYLGHSVERFSSKLYVPIVRGRSSIGRLGLFVHITADLIDFGSDGQYTLMFHAVQPIKIYAGMQIGQVTFWEMDGERKRYNGKYQHSKGPMPSQVHKDFL